MKFLNKLATILIVFAFASNICVPITKAQGLTTPVPSSEKFQYVYSATDNSLTENVTTNSADYTATGRKYINPEATTKANIVGQTAESAYVDLLLGFIKSFTGVDGAEEGYLAFQLKGVENIYLLVRLRSRNTIGLYTKSNTDYNVLVPIEEDGNVIIKEGSRSGFNAVTLPDNVVQYAATMNGVVSGWLQTQHYTAPSHQAGIGAEVKDLVNAETISVDITICGKVDGIPASTGGDLTQVGAGSSPYLLLQYNLNDKMYVNASLRPTGTPQIVSLDSNGNFSFNMKDMPAGTYHLFGTANVFFNSSRRVISYGSVNAQTFVDPLFKEEGTTENYTTDVLELKIDKDGNINDPSYKSPNCKALFTFAQVTNATTSAEETICDKIKGTYFLSMFYQGLCSAILAASRFADSAFKYAIELMSKSIGVATNNAYVPEISTTYIPPGSSTTTTTTQVIFGNPQTVSSTNATDAATELCKLAQTQNLTPPISNEPCVIKNLRYKDSVSGDLKDSNAGVQIVKDGLAAFIQNGNQPNMCGTNNLIILKTDCTFSGTVGTVNIN